MHKIASLVGGILLAQPLVGCGSHLGGGDAVDVHGVDVASREGAVIHHRADGDAAYVFSRDDVHRICALPPASAARELARAAPAEASDDERSRRGRDADARALQEQADRVLFLQFAFYRLCESRANGDFAPTLEGCEVIVDRAAELAKELVAAEEEHSKADGAVEDAKLSGREPTKEELVAQRRAKLKERKVRRAWLRALENKSACERGSYEETFVKILDTAVKLGQQPSAPEKKKSPKAKPKKKRRPARGAAPTEPQAAREAPATPGAQGTTDARPKGVAPGERGAPRKEAPRSQAPDGRGPSER